LQAKLRNRTTLESRDGYPIPSCSAPDLLSRLLLATLRGWSGRFWQFSRLVQPSILVIYLLGCLGTSTGILGFVLTLACLLVCSSAWLECCVLGRCVLGRCDRSLAKAAEVACHTPHNVLNKATTRFFLVLWSLPLLGFLFFLVLLIRLAGIERLPRVTIPCRMVVRELSKVRTSPTIIFLLVLLRVVHFVLSVHTVDYTAIRSSLELMVPSHYLIKWNFNGSELIFYWVRIL
jgi:hypothetical protein